VANRGLQRQLAGVSARSDQRLASLEA
jgi:hypothetical protein